MATIKELTLTCLIEKWNAIKNISDDLLGDCAFCIDAKERLVVDGGTLDNNNYCSYCIAPETMCNGSKVFSSYQQLRKDKRLNDTTAYSEHLTQFKLNIDKLITDGEL